MTSYNYTKLGYLPFKKRENVLFKNDTAYYGVEKFNVLSTSLQSSFLDL